jgi:hypothetical protein
VTVAKVGVGTGTDPDAARRAARAILAEGRFHAPGVPRPLHGVLTAIGDAVSAPFSAPGHLVDDLSTAVPGGIAGVWAAFAIVVLALTALLARQHAHRALRGASAGTSAASPAGGAELERLADRAEHDGRLEDAVRLRFRAGLARLSERRAIASASTVRTAEVSRALHSPPFDRLAHRFDEIAYGGVPAAPDDVAQARRDWAAVVARGAKR